MIIGVDARPLSYRLTGIGYYLWHLLKAIGTADQKNSYILISNKKIPFDCPRQNWRKVEGHMGARFLSTFWMQAFAPYFARRMRLDLFWGPRHHLPLLLPNNVKTVVTIHDLVHQRYPETMAPENLIVERIFMNRSVKKADAIITVSRATARDLDAFYPGVGSKVYNTYPGIPEFGSQSPGTDEGKWLQDLPAAYFLFVGTLEPRKNLVTVIRAFEQLSAVHKDLHLIVAGNIGWKSKKWVSALVHSPARARILLPGYVSRKTLKLLYLNALCLLFPSYYEGFGMPLLEAMSLGVPVITSNLSSMAEVAGDAALLVDPRSAEDIARAMGRIFEEPELRKKLVEKAEKRRERFSWQSCATRTLKIFEQASGDREGTADL